MYGALSFMIKCRIALIVLGCLLCIGAGMGVAALCAEPVEADALPPDPIWAVPLGEDLHYRLDGEGSILLICEVYNTLDEPITLSDVYVSKDPEIESITLETIEIPAAGSGLVRITAYMKDSCRENIRSHSADVDMIFHWERGSALISLPLSFHTEPPGA